MALDPAVFASRLTDEDLVPREDKELSCLILRAKLERIRREFMTRQLFPALDDVRTTLKRAKRLNTQAQLIREALTTQSFLVCEPPETEFDIDLTSEEAVVAVLEIAKTAQGILEQLLEFGEAVSRRCSAMIRIAEKIYSPHPAAGFFSIPRHDQGCDLYFYKVQLVSVHEMGGNLQLDLCWHKIESHARTVTPTTDDLRRFVDALDLDVRVRNLAYFTAETGTDLPYTETVIPLARKKLKETISWKCGFCSPGQDRSQSRTVPAR